MMMSTPFLGRDHANQNDQESASSRIARIPRPTEPGSTSLLRSSSTWPSLSTSATRSTWSGLARCSRESLANCPGADAPRSRSVTAPRRSACPWSRSAFACPERSPSVQNPKAELTLFDFGAISLAVRFPLLATPSKLLQLAGALAEPAPQNEAARQILAPWIQRLRPAVYRLRMSSMSEEYIVFQLGEPRSRWLENHADWIAGLIRLESEPLSRHEVSEATRLSLSYTPTDLVVLDWAAGFVVDAECADTLQVIEFANVQLLEFRHIDDRLDDRLEAAYRLIRPDRRRRWGAGLWKTHGDAVRQVRELEIEAASLFERVDNALKLIGDHYLSRVFDLTSTRFHLPRVAAIDPPQARDRGQRLRPARPAGRRTSHGGSGRSPS